MLQQHAADDGKPLRYSVQLRSFSMTCELVADGVGIVQGRTDYADGDVYANLWVIGFAADGRAHSFVEWAIEPGPGWRDEG